MSLPNAKKLRAETNKKLAEEAEQVRLQKVAYDATLPERKASQIEYTLNRIAHEITEVHKKKETVIRHSERDLYDGVTNSIKSSLEEQGFKVIFENKWVEDTYGDWYSQTMFEISW